MTSIQERLQRKREPLDKWSTREQLCLAYAVLRSGDQNWMSVSRALKPFGEPNRPADWFHQKNCAAQYGVLLENVETPKRKKRSSGVDTPLETPAESILKKLIQERKAELKKLMDEERTEFLKLKDEMVLLKSGNISEEQLDAMCKQIDDEEQQKEKEALIHAQWLKERELKKLEIERAWRPAVKMGSPLPVTGQKRKASDSADLMDIDSVEGRVTPTQNEPSKPALSPLLTSLLKSPSHAQNVTTSSILHSAITSQRPINSNPTIASLLNRSTSQTSVQVSPGLQQLVTTAISQEPTNQIIKDPISDLLDTADPLPNLQAEDIDSISDAPLPEIKIEEVDIIMSDLIENADIVTDPEQHLLDGNDDIIKDFENKLVELVNKEKAVEAAQAAKENKALEKQRELPIIDPFEFQEDPEIYEPSKPSSSLMKQIPSPIDGDDDSLSKDQTSTDLSEESECKKESDDSSKDKEETLPGSVEIVEVVVMEDEDISKELNKSQIEDIVHSSKTLLDSDKIKEELIEIKDDNLSEETSESLDLELKSVSPCTSKDKLSEIEDSVSRRNTFTPEYPDIFDDDMNIEVTKLDTIGKAKRDYSRTKKKEETDFDMLMAVEQEIRNLQGDAESLSEKEDDKKDVKLKLENERSNSPWTEEEEINNVKRRRRYSTPATPVDSVPNSPASSSAYVEDDKEYKSWKKGVMFVFNRLATHKYASLFLKPITNEQAPEYHNIVKRPMDLHTIRKNIDSGIIRSTIEFQRDILLMFNNAIMYNKTNDTVHKMALDMQQEGVEHIRILLLAQAETVPSRRETRTSEGPGNKRKRLTDESVNRNKKRKED